MKIGSIVIRCYEFDKMLAFWQQALHYVPRAPSDGAWVVLRDLEGKGPNISLQRVLRLAIRGATGRALISWSWKTPMATCSASFRSPGDGSGVRSGISSDDTSGERRARNDGESLTAGENSVEVSCETGEHHDSLRPLRSIKRMHATAN
jgi:hypothetical protein